MEDNRTHNLQKNMQEQAGCSDAAPTKRYSAIDIAEMVNSRSIQLFDIDFGLCTDWYKNDDFIEDIFSHVNREEDMKQLAELILLKQDYQTNTLHHPKVCYRVTDYRKYIPYVMDLQIRLDAIYTRVLHNREVLRKMNGMKDTWISTETSPTVLHETDDTAPPAFTENTTDLYRMEDLPEDIRKHILLKNNHVYTLFVSALKGPVKKWIDKHRLQDWNVVRFICRYWKFIPRKLAMNDFARFLEEIGLGNQLDNMKKRTDANDKSALLVYEDPKVGNRLWRLKSDGKEVEELLQDVINAHAT